MVVDRIVLHDQKAQTMPEYAVVLGVITFAIVTAISLLSGAVTAAFQRTLDVVSTIT